MRNPFLLLAVLFLIVYGCSMEKVHADAQEEAMAGGSLNTGQAADLENYIAKNPDDLSTRTKLLGYYFMRQYSSWEAKQAHQKHVLWIIKNRPESKIAGLPYCGLNAILDGDTYLKAKQLWLDQTKANSASTAILGNAAGFFLIHDKDIAEDLLRQAQKVEPNNPQWPDRLGHLYELRSYKDNSAAAKAVEEFEKAQSEDNSESSKFNRLGDLAKSAFQAGETEKASSYATTLLATAQEQPEEKCYGDAIHIGNSVLGRIALKQGNVKTANEYLLKSGQTPGSPVLGSFGPSMILAKELLEKGEKDAVLQYFEQCRKFWKMGGERLDTWTEEVKAGKTPNFGGNLHY
jgi:hypothetical protein